MIFRAFGDLFFGEGTGSYSKSLRVVVMQQSGTLGARSH
jgi:hypothetical protein